MNASGEEPNLSPLLQTTTEPVAVVAHEGVGRRTRSHAAGVVEEEQQKELPPPPPPMSLLDTIVHQPSVPQQPQQHPQLEQELAASSLVQSQPELPPTQADIPPTQMHVEVQVQEDSLSIGQQLPFTQPFPYGGTPPGGPPAPQPQPHPQPPTAPDDGRGRHEEVPFRRRTMEAVGLEQVHRAVDHVLNRQGEGEDRAEGVGSGERGHSRWLVPLQRFGASFLPKRKTPGSNKGNESRKEGEAQPQQPQQQQQAPRSSSSPRQLQFSQDRNVAVMPAPPPRAFTPPTTNAALQQQAQLEQANNEDNEDVEMEQVDEEVVIIEERDVAAAQLLQPLEQQEEEGEEEGEEAEAVVIVDRLEEEGEAEGSGGEAGASVRVSGAIDTGETEQGDVAGMTHPSSQLRQQEQERNGRGDDNIIDNGNNNNVAVDLQAASPPHHQHKRDAHLATSIDARYDVGGGEGLDSPQGGAAASPIRAAFPINQPSSVEAIVMEEEVGEEGAGGEGGGGGGGERRWVSPPRPPPPPQWNASTVDIVERRGGGVIQQLYTGPITRAASSVAQNGGGGGGGGTNNYVGIGPRGSVAFVSPPMPPPPPLPSRGGEGGGGFLGGVGPMTQEPLMWGGTQTQTQTQAQHDEPPPAPVQQQQQEQQAPPPLPPSPPQPVVTATFAANNNIQMGEYSRLGHAGVVIAVGPSLTDTAAAEAVAGPDGGGGGLGAEVVPQPTEDLQPSKGPGIATMRGRPLDAEGDGEEEGGEEEVVAPMKKGEGEGADSLPDTVQEQGENDDMVEVGAFFSHRMNAVVVTMAAAAAEDERNQRKRKEAEAARAGDERVAEVEITAAAVAGSGGGEKEEEEEEPRKTKKRRTRSAGTAEPQEERGEEEEQREGGGGGVEQGLVPPALNMTRRVFHQGSTRREVQEASAAMPSNIQATPISALTGVKLAARLKIQKLLQERRASSMDGSAGGRVTPTVLPTTGPFARQQQQRQRNMHPPPPPLAAPAAPMHATPSGVYPPQVRQQQQPTPPQGRTPAPTSHPTSSLSEALQLFYKMSGKKPPPAT